MQSSVKNIKIVSVLENIIQFFLLCYACSTTDQSDSSTPTNPKTNKPAKDTIEEVFVGTASISWYQNDKIEGGMYSVDEEEEKQLEDEDVQAPKSEESKRDPEKDGEAPDDEDVHHVLSSTTTEESEYSS